MILHFINICCVLAVVVCTDAELDEKSVDNVFQCEDRIVSQSRAFSQAGSQDQIESKDKKFTELLHPLGLETRLVVLRHANSIALYFICMTLSAVTSLREQWRSRKLKRTIESLFNFFMGVTRPVRVRKLTWPLTDYERSLDFFISMTGKQTILYRYISLLFLCWYYNLM